jgi:hypothetical protein
MAIGSALQKGSYVYAYDEKGHQLFSVHADQLLGFTGSTVTVKKGSYAYTYDEKGHQQYSKHM